MAKKHKAVELTKTKVSNHLKVVLTVAVCLALAALGLALIPEEKAEFIFAENPGRWQVSPGTRAEIVNGGLRLTRGQGDMFVAVPLIMVDADVYNVAVIEARSPVAYDPGMLLFTSPFNKEFQFNFRFENDTGRANRWNRSYLNLRSHPAWQGYVRDILVIPAASAGTAEIRSIRFVSANPWTKVKAWWGTFSRYYDPKLGTCFIMSSPMFHDKPFSSFFGPLLWWLLGGSLLVFILARMGILTDRIRAYAVIVLALAFLLIWGLLEARNNVYYLKGIGRARSLYWGRSLDEKRGIVTGDPKFVEFMKYCDGVIPLDARVFNLVSSTPRGTAWEYLKGTQFLFQLRPRLNSIYQFTDEFPEIYYVVYQTDPKKLRGTDHNQWVVNDYIELSENESVSQRVLLWNRLEDIDQVKLKMPTGARLLPGDIKLELLSEDGRELLAAGELIKVATFESVFVRQYAEPVFKVKPLAPYEKSWIILRVKNQGKKSVPIGFARKTNPYTQGAMQGRNDGFSYQGKELTGELAFSIEFLIKDPLLLHKFSEDAYIFKKRGKKR